LPLVVVLVQGLFGCASTAPALRVVDAQYRAIERGDLEAWSSAFAARALLFGTDPEETYFGREAIAEKVGEAASGRMRSDVERHYRSTGGRRIGLAPDGRSAWIADAIAYTLTSSAGQRSHSFRLTELLAEDDGRWTILAAHYSVAVPDKEALGRRWPAPRPVPDAVAPGAEALAALAAGESAHFAGEFTDRPDVWLYGTAPEEQIAGGLEVQRFTRQGQPGPARVLRTSGVAAGLAPSGTTGWLAYTALLSIPAGEGVAELPVRVLAVFLWEGGGWKKVQEHVSLPVPD
jgi:hypothetical protein